MRKYIFICFLSLILLSLPTYSIHVNNREHQTSSVVKAWYDTGVNLASDGYKYIESTVNGLGPINELSRDVLGWIRDVAYSTHYMKITNSMTYIGAIADHSSPSQLIELLNHKSRILYPLKDENWLNTMDYFNNMKKWNQNMGSFMKLADYTNRIVWALDDHNWGNHVEFYKQLPRMNSFIKSIDKLSDIEKSIPSISENLNRFTNIKDFFSLGMKFLDKISIEKIISYGTKLLNQYDKCISDPVSKYSIYSVLSQFFDISKIVDLPMCLVEPFVDLIKDFLGSKILSFLTQATMIAKKNIAKHNTFIQKILNHQFTLIEIDDQTIVCGDIADKIAANVETSLNLILDFVFGVVKFLSHIITLIFRGFDFKQSSASCKAKTPVSGIKPAECELGIPNKWSLIGVSIKESIDLIEYWIHFLISALGSVRGWICFDIDLISVQQKNELDSKLESFLQKQENLLQKI